MRMILLLLMMSAGFSMAAGSAVANPLDARRDEFRKALQQAERGPSLSPPTHRGLLSHPLYPYLEYAELRREITRIDGRDVRALLDRHAALPFAPALRDAWLRELARRRDWSQFRAWQPEPAELAERDVELRCHALQARLAAGSDAALLDAIARTWTQGASLPGACDGPFAALQAAGKIDAELRWQRIVLAAESNNLALMRYVARGLPAAQQKQAEAYADFIETPGRQALQWPRDARSRQIVVAGLQRMARRDTTGSEALLAALAAPLGLDDTQRGLVQQQVALWSAASYEADAARRMAAVPAAQFTPQLHEWRAREALARGDHGATLAAIEVMPTELRADPRWRYLDARMRELTGDKAGAEAVFATLATEPNYFGFLSADRLGASYALCPLEPSNEHALREAVQQRPELVRALELHALDRTVWATREWNALVGTLDDEQRRIAVELAVDAGWTDRAVFALAQGDDQRVYRLRFPLAHAKHLRREAAANGLDPAWVAALIRAESAWQPSAHSHANARGLMQLLPGTAADVSRRLGRRWGGPSSLFEPRTNITLGNAHLAELMQRYGGAVAVATAAYNAGPTPVARWLAQRPAMPTDLWIETIPYRETREYVARIMAFSAIYDWRFGGRAVPLVERMRGKTGPAVAVREFGCPPPAGLATTAADAPAPAQ